MCIYSFVGTVLEVMKLFGKEVCSYPHLTSTLARALIEFRPRIHFGCDFTLRAYRQALQCCERFSPPDSKQRFAQDRTPVRDARSFGSGTQLFPWLIDSVKYDTVLELRPYY